MSTSCPVCKIQKTKKADLQKKLAPLVFKDLFNGITEDDILKLVNGKLIHRGITLSHEQKNSIINEAESLKSNNALTAIISDLKFTANKRIFHDSVCLEDILAGKMALWVIDLLEKKIQNLANIK